jgi:hypothetical protein
MYEKPVLTKRQRLPSIVAQLIPISQGTEA